jgi:hypothetical protein
MILLQIWSAYILGTVCALIYFYFDNSPRFMSFEDYKEYAIGHILFALFLPFAVIWKIFNEDN